MVIKGMNSIHSPVPLRVRFRAFGPVKIHGRSFAKTFAINDSKNPVKKSLTDSSSSLALIKHDLFLQAWPAPREDSCRRLEAPIHHKAPRGRPSKLAVYFSFAHKIESENV